MSRRRPPRPAYAETGHRVPPPSICAQRTILWQMNRYESISSWCAGWQRRLSEQNLSRPSGAPNQRRPLRFGPEDVVPIAELRTLPLVRPSRLRALIPFSVTFTLPMSALLAGIAVYTLRTHGIPVSWLIGVESGGIFMVVALAWLLANVSTNLGVLLASGGITVFYRVPARGQAGRATYTWSELTRPTTPGFLPQSVCFETTERRLFLDFRQARAVLSDSRFPHRSAVSREVWERIEAVSSRN